VQVSVPQTALDGFQSRFDEAILSSDARKLLASYREAPFSLSNQSDLIREHNPDAILCGHWPALAMQRKPAQPVILDLAGPHLLERHYEERGSGGVALDNLVKAKLKALTIADYCIVSGDSQRYYFLSFLLRAGREDLASRLVTIPMPLPPELPQRGERSGEVRYLFGGVFLPWQDPQITIFPPGSIASCFKSSLTTHEFAPFRWFPMRSISITS
jgi:hypothetical protein